ncbi:MAG: hypothetical protein ABW321_24615 [Polyangiales bacterium]
MVRASTATITEPFAAELMVEYRRIGLKPEAIVHVVSQPADVDTSEIVIRPVASR